MTIAARRKRTLPRKPHPVGDLLIIECDSQALARTAMNLGTWFGMITSAAFRDKRIVLVQTSTEAMLKDELDAVFTKHGPFRSILIVGHSNANGLVLTSNGLVPWADVGERIKRFQPKHLFLVACEAGRSKSVRNVFQSVKSLREIYASPVPLLKIHTAPMGVLIGMQLLKGKITLEESGGLRIASFISWGVQTYCWRRDEMGEGQEVSPQFWDALADWLGETNWDFADELVKGLKRLVGATR